MSQKKLVCSVPTILLLGRHPAFKPYTTTAFSLSLNKNLHFSTDSKELGIGKISKFDAGAESEKYVP